MNDAKQETTAAAMLFGALAGEDAVALTASAIPPALEALAAAEALVECSGIAALDVLRAAMTGHPQDWVLDAYSELIADLDDVLMQLVDTLALISGGAYTECGGDTTDDAERTRREASVARLRDSAQAAREAGSVEVTL